METVHDKLRRHAYRNTDPYPQAPARPIPVFTTATTSAEIVSVVRFLKIFQNHSSDQTRSSASCVL
jgi:hypothetical protein